VTDLRTAVVGSGPSGIYAADALVRDGSRSVSVDILDRLPAPYGLVRYGVAPDHPRIKSIIIALQRVLEHDRVRYLGNITVGDQISPDELDRHYDATVYATGASLDRRLDIPGEDLLGSHPATELVSWYSGHPDSRASFRFDAASVAVVGAGNVALDVARLLAKTETELADTDMPPAVLAALADSRVRNIHIVCRRGPEEAKFSSKELRELGELAAAGVVLDADVVPEPHDGHPPVVAANLRVLRQLAAAPPAAPDHRRVHLHFWRRPVAVLGAARVEGLQLEVMQRLASGEIRGTGRTQTIPAGMVIRAVGHRAVPLPGVPFAADRGFARHSAGRLLDANGVPMPGRYVTGWVKRGPSGVIGTNRVCAQETVSSLLADLSTVDEERSSDVDQLLAARGVRVVPYTGWLNIDAAEIERGRAAGRPRIKISDWNTLRRLGSVA
jgi:ferredoxin--NADP+ reductase